MIRQIQTAKLPMTPIEVIDTSVKIGLGALISGAAAYFPSRRAAGIDPIDTLRYD